MVSSLLVCIMHLMMSFTLDMVEHQLPLVVGGEMERHLVVVVEMTAIVVEHPLVVVAEMTAIVVERYLVDPEGILEQGLVGRAMILDLASLYKPILNVCSVIACTGAIFIT